MKTPPTRIENCSISVNSAANEHTRDAIVALANAAEANARAIEAAAKALSHGPAVTGIAINSPQN